MPVKIGNDSCSHRKSRARQLAKGMLQRPVRLVVCFQEAEHAEHGALLLLSSSDGPLCLAVASALIKYQTTGLLIFLIYASGLRITWRASLS